MRLTVAMCTYNPDREVMLAAIEAIVAQITEVPSVEIVVIDNNSDPSLAERGYLSDYPVRLIRESRPGLTAAREAAIDNAQGDVIVFVDDDNILGRHYLRTALEAFASDPTLGLLGGSIVPKYSAPPPKWFREFEPWLAVRHYPSGFCLELTALPANPPYTKHFPVGAGFATRREVAVAYTCDCTETKRIEGRKGQELSSGEDLDYGFFVLNNGYKLVVTGALSLTHVIAPGRLRVDYLKRLASGSVRSAWALEEKWSPRFGRPIYPMLSMSLVETVARATVTAMLGLGSRRYRIKHHVYTTLTRLRIAAMIDSN